MFARPSLSFLALGLALLIHGPSQAQEASRPVGAAPIENRGNSTAQSKPPAPKAPATKPDATKTDSAKAAGSTSTTKPASKDGKPPSSDKAPSKDAKGSGKDTKASGTDKSPSKDNKAATPAKPQAKDGKPASTDKATSKDGKPTGSDKAQGKDSKPSGSDKTPPKPGTTDKVALDKDGKPVVAKRAPVGPAVSKKNSLAILPLQSADWKAGCGCRFFKPTDQKENGPLLLRLDDKKVASIRAEGNLEKLKLVDERHVQRKPPAIMAHDRMMLKFKGTSTTASFSGSAERNCAKFQDSCKSATYQGVLSLNQMGKQGSFPVWGICGCQ